MKIKLLACAFCKNIPSVRPLDPKTEGNAWGAVSCVSPCPVQPEIADGRVCAEDDTNYRAVAIRRWNKAMREAQLPIALPVRRIEFTSPDCLLS